MSCVTPQMMEEIYFFYEEWNNRKILYTSGPARIRLDIFILT
jgi:hypothetical protein